MITNSEIERFNSKIKVNSKGCMEWQDALDRDGYGSFFLRGSTRRAHRVSWVIAHGPIGVGLVVGHLCNNRACVNPQHLKPMTTLENSLENSSSIPAINARKTHCKQGHLFDKSYQSKKGKVRYCSICQSAKTKRLRTGRIDTLKGIV